MTSVTSQPDEPPVSTGEATPDQREVTRADVEAHSLVVEEFVNRLVARPLVQELFAHWREETEIGHRVTVAAGLRRTLAHDLGFHDQAGFYAGVTLKRIEASIAESRNDPGAEVRKRRQCMIDALREVQDKIDVAAEDGDVDYLVVGKAHDVCLELGILGSDVPDGLVRVWIAMALADAFGCQIPAHVAISTAGQVDTPAPQIDYHLRPVPSESLSSFSVRAVRSFEAEIVEPISAVWAASTLPSGKRSKPEGVRRYAGWLFRNRVEGTSVRRIAKEAKVDRNHVHHGLRQAQRWLEVENPWVDVEAPG